MGLFMLIFLAYPKMCATPINVNKNNMHIKKLNTAMLILSMLMYYEHC